MKKFFEKLQILPIIGLLFLFFYIFGLEVIVIGKSLIPAACSSVSCTEDENVSNHNGDSSRPHIEIKGIKFIDWKLDTEPTIEIVAYDEESGIDPESFVLYEDIAGDPQPIYVSETDEISYTREGNVYTFTYEPKEALPDRYSVFYFAQICNCAGKSALSARFTSTCHDAWCEFNTYPAYILQYLVWYLVIFGPMIIKRPWGTVYDSKKKSPVSRAVVRLYKDNELVDTAVTDSLGHFKLSPPPGTYSLGVQCSGYTFPSSLKPKTTDGRLNDLYYGGKFEQKESSPLPYNVPLDPVTEEKVSLARRINTEASTLLSSLNLYLLLVCAITPVLIWGFDLESITFSLINWILIGMHLLARKRGSVAWGVLLDEKGKPIQNAKLKLREATYNQNVETQVTDEKGRFQFVVPGGKYTIELLSDTNVLDKEKNPATYGEESKDTIVIAPKLRARKAAQQPSVSEKKDNNS